MFLLKPAKKNDLNNVQAMFSDVIGCSIGIYDFTLLNSSIKSSASVKR